MEVLKNRIDASLCVTGKFAEGRVFYAFRTIAELFLFFFIMEDKKFVQMDFSNVILILNDYKRRRMMSEDPCMRVHKNKKSGMPLFTTEGGLENGS